MRLQFYTWSKRNISRRFYRKKNDGILTRVLINTHQMKNFQLMLLLMLTIQCYFLNKKCFTHTYFLGIFLKLFHDVLFCLKRLLNIAQSMMLAQITLLKPLQSLFRSILSVYVAKHEHVPSRHPVFNMLFGSILAIGYLFYVNISCWVLI